MMMPWSTVTTVPLPLAAVAMSLPLHHLSLRGSRSLPPFPASAEVVVAFKLSVYFPMQKSLNTTSKSSSTSTLPVTTPRQCTATRSSSAAISTCSGKVHQPCKVDSGHDGMPGMECAHITQHYTRSIQSMLTTNLTRIRQESIKGLQTVCDVRPVPGPRNQSTTGLDSIRDVKSAVSMSDIQVNLCYVD